MGLRPRSSFSGNTKIEIPLQCTVGQAASENRSGRRNREGRQIGQACNLFIDTGNKFFCRYGWHWQRYWWKNLPPMLLILVVHHDLQNFPWIFEKIQNDCYFQGLGGRCFMKKTWSKKFCDSVPLIFLGPWKFCPYKNRLAVKNFFHGRVVSLKKTWVSFSWPKHAAFLQMQYDPIFCKLAVLYPARGPF
jgi:hypothetical protein